MLPLFALKFTLDFSLCILNDKITLSLVFIDVFLQLFNFITLFICFFSKVIILFLHIFIDLLNFFVKSDFLPFILFEFIIVFNFVINVFFEFTKGLTLILLLHQEFHHYLELVFVRFDESLVAVDIGVVLKLSAQFLGRFLQLLGNIHDILLGLSELILMAKAFKLASSSNEHGVSLFKSSLFIHGLCDFFVVLFMNFFTHIFVQTIKEIEFSNKIFKNN